MAKRSALGQSSDRHEVLQVTRGGGTRRLRDAYVILGAQAALEAVDTFSEQTGDDLGLTFVEAVAKPFVELGRARSS